MGADPPPGAFIPPNARTFRPAPTRCSRKPPARGSLRPAAAPWSADYLGKWRAAVNRGVAPDARRVGTEGSEPTGQNGRAITITTITTIAAVGTSFMMRK